MVIEKDVEGLIKALKHKDSVVRRQAAEALGKMGDSRAVDPLIQALKDEDPIAREYAAEALGEIGDTRAVGPLIQALKDGDWDVREHAAEALGKIGDTRAAGPLIQALRDEDPVVREEAADALGEMGEPAVGPLVQALRDGDWDVREEAAEALDKLGWKPRDDTEETRYLLAKQDWDGLVRLGKPAVKPLIKVLKDEEDWNVRAGAAEALGRIGDARAVKPLKDALHDRHRIVREKAAEALTEMLGPNG